MKTKRKCIYFTEDAIEFIEENKSSLPFWKYKKFSISSFINHLIEKEREESLRD